MNLIKRMTWLHWVLCCFYPILLTALTLTIICQIGPQWKWLGVLTPYITILDIASFLYLGICGFNLLFNGGRFSPIWPELKPASE